MPFSGNISPVESPIASCGSLIPGVLMASSRIDPTEKFNLTSDASVVSGIAMTSFMCVPNDALDAGRWVDLIDCFLSVIFVSEWLKSPSMT